MGDGALCVSSTTLLGVASEPKVSSSNQNLFAPKKKGFNKNPKIKIPTKRNKTSCLLCRCCMFACLPCRQRSHKTKQKSKYPQKQINILSAPVCHVRLTTKTKQTSVCLFAMSLLHVCLFEQQKKKKEPVCLFAVIQTHPKKSTKRKHLFAMSLQFACLLQSLDGLPLTH